MPTYCGITTDPKTRKEQHKRKFPKLSNWRIVKTFKTKKEAQDWENRQTGCRSHAGGTARGPWYGYKFEY